MAVRISGVLLGSLFAVLVAPPALADEPVGETAVARVKISSGKTEVKHPGHLIEFDLENTLVIQDGGKHEVTLLVTRKGKGFSVQVTYKKNGRTVVTGSTNVAKNKWGNVKKGSTTVAVLIDPDSKRPDDVDKPEDDDPLGGL